MFDGTDPPAEKKADPKARLFHSADNLSAIFSS
jgi:hypothetical protein